jgi:hypothetical protein
LQNQLEAERRRRGALAYDQQALRARILRLETELVLVEEESSAWSPEETSPDAESLSLST